MLAETNNSAKSVIEAFSGAKVNILIQEFIKEAGGADVRCFVIGDRVVAAMLRQGVEGDFRSNLHRGGPRTHDENIVERTRCSGSMRPRAWGLMFAVSTCCAAIAGRSSWK